jgi:hypothetical protein
MFLMKCKHLFFKLENALVRIHHEAQFLEKHLLKPSSAQIFLVIMKFCYNLRKNIHTEKKCFSGRFV